MLTSFQERIFGSQYLIIIVEHTPLPISYTEYPYKYPKSHNAAVGTIPIMNISF